MIAVDWGSSGFRVYRIDDSGRILDRRSLACGIATLRSGEHAALLLREAGDWLVQDADGPVLLCGMIGSRQGWVEAPYLRCPAAPADIVKHLVPVMLGDRQALIVPGLSCLRQDGCADVMRGEETQILGLAPDGERPAMLCMPGTHSKHVRWRQGRIDWFATAMTGEIYALLQQHSLLAPLLQTGPDVPPADPEAFLAGVGHSSLPGGLLQHLFGIRGDRLLDRRSAAGEAEFLSGLLIGHELRGTDWQEAGAEVTIVAAPALAARYHAAFSALGIAAHSGPEDAAAAGLYRLGRMIWEDRT